MSSQYDPQQGINKEQWEQKTSYQILFNPQLELDDVTPVSIYWFTIVAPLGESKSDRMWQTFPFDSSCVCGFPIRPGLKKLRTFWTARGSLLFQKNVEMGWVDNAKRFHYNDVWSNVPNNPFGLRSSRWFHVFPLSFQINLVTTLPLQHHFLCCSMGILNWAWKSLSCVQQKGVDVWSFMCF